MRYPEDVVEDVRTRTNIVDLISGYVKLQRKGGNYFGLCPFHNEKSPSFSVSPGKQMYYCFGCGEGGNVFTFLMKYENYTFPEAVKTLADRAGIRLPEPEESGEARERSDKKSRLYEINKKAAKYFYCRLRSQSGALGLDYLKKRGLSDQTMQSFGLGYSDQHRNDLYRFMKKEGYPDELLRESGLFQADETHGMQDKFWNRVIFPIMDVNRRVIGFGGRVMGDGKPKYLNSPETLIFDKSRNLYGLHVARSARKPNLIICEGYMDVISMHQAGFTNAVASLGTALTSQQASLLKRYTNEVLIIYDSDEAGIKAALRAIPMLQAVGLATKVVNLSPHKDPDEFIGAEGMEAFRERLEQAENFFHYEVRMLARGYEMNDPQSKTLFVDQTALLLLRFENEIERTLYLEAFCREYHVDPDMMRRRVNQLALKGVGREEIRTPRSLEPAKKEKETGTEKAQKLMLTWITNFPELMNRLEPHLHPEDFLTPLYREVAEMIFAQWKNGSVNPAQIINHFEDGEKQTEVASLFHTQIALETEEEKEKALKDVLCKMKGESLQYRLDHLDPENLNQLQALMDEKKRLEQFRLSGRL